MTARRLPLWLFLDPTAWLPLMFSVWRMVLAMREMLSRPDDGSGRVARADFLRAAAMLAEIEADLEWAIARQARRLCGRSTDGLARVAPAPARTLAAFHARYRENTVRLANCTAIAEQRATRALRAASGPGRLAARLGAARATPAPSRRRVRIAAGIRARGGPRSRAPPYRLPSRIAISRALPASPARSRAHARRLPRGAYFSLRLA